MNKTLKEKVEELLKNAKLRNEFLQQSMKEYAEMGSYENAARVDVKIGMLALFINNLEKVLK